MKSKFKFPCLLFIIAMAIQSVAAIREVGSGRTYTTVQACLNAAVAGDTCNVHAGTYNEHVSFPNSGAAGTPISLRANPGDVVTLQSSTAPIVDINGQSHLVIEGLRLTYTGTGTDAAGVNNNRGRPDDITLSNNVITLQSGSCAISRGSVHIYYSDHLTMTGNTMAVHSTGACDGAELLFSSNLQFTGNTIFGDPYGYLEDGMVVSGTNLNIENNVLHDGWSYDTHPDGIVIQGDGDRTGANSANITVLRNTVYNFTQGIYLAPAHKGLFGSNLVANNVVYENGYQYPKGTYDKMNGIVIDGNNVDGTSGLNINADIFNNTIDVRQIAVYGLRYESGSPVTLKNNIILNPNYGGVYIIVTPGVVLDYNYYSQGNARPIKWGSTAYSLTDFKASGIGEAHGVIGSANLGSGYIPTATSDSNGRALNLYSIFTVDKANVVRPATGSWDMGAYQNDRSTQQRPLPPQSLTVVGVQ